jgi:alkanesulfonate monooxygenase SsuD/methylene tetrahydromethanopterin reductase-like flavin-dependent oxidoreductase (luciferase family)
MANPRLRKELLETVRDLHAAGAIDFKQEFEIFRVVQAPAPLVPPSAPLPPNCVVSVLLQPGESAEWTWTHDTNGSRYVTGYTIIRPRRRTRSRPATQ